MWLALVEDNISISKNSKTRKKKENFGHDENGLFYPFKFFENKKNAFKNKENVFSYENETKTNFKNKKNKFTIFNILYMNQKTGKNCFPCFRIKSKTRNFMDLVKMKTPNSSFLLFIPFSYEGHNYIISIDHILLFY